MKKISLLLAFVAFFAATTSAKTADINLVKTKIETSVEKDEFSKLKEIKETKTVKDFESQDQLFPLSIQASCGTFTFEYTCPGCTWSQIQGDIEILSAWSELTCMIFF